ncbi:MAG: hypothetical protein ACI4UK_03870 [Floccifex sp.]
MRKTKIFALTITSIVFVLNMGCEKKEEDSYLTNYSNMDNSEGTEISYENLLFTKDFTIEQPEFKSFDTFEMTAMPDLTPQELYERFDKTVELYFPNVFSAEEKTELYDVNGTDYNGNQLTGNFSENKERIFSGEVPLPWLWFTCDKGMIQMYPNGAIQSVTCSVAFDIDDTETDTVGMYCSADENKITEKIRIPLGEFESNISYPLLNGSTKLSDAIDFTEHFLNTRFDSGVGNPVFIADITEAWVVDMGDGVYGYHFWLTSTYKGIRLDTNPMNTGLGFSCDMSSCKLYDIYPGYAFMIENDKLDSIMAFGYRRAYNVKNIQSHEISITFNDAVNILSESISDKANMEISRAEFVYTPYQENESDNSILTVDAAWKFTARNANDNYDYIFFVNAVTGEVDYYTY